LRADRFARYDSMLDTDDILADPPILVARPSRQNDRAITLETWRTGNHDARCWFGWRSQQAAKELQKMTATAIKRSIAGLAIAGSLGAGTTGASAQAVYVDPYVQPYPVVVAPGTAYIAPAPIVAPPPIVRERVVVGRSAYVPAPVYSYRAPPAPYGYSGYSYAADVVVDPDW
jgi:hypothetical protein